MISPPPLSVAVQMEVLLSRADVATWSLNRLGLPPEWRDTNVPGNTERCREAVDRLFTLTRSELEGWLAENLLLPEQLPGVRTAKDSKDGTYFIAEKNSWVYYYQERGAPWAGVTFDSLAEARVLLINEFLPAWLSRLDRPCRTREGRMITRL